MNEAEIFSTPNVVSPQAEVGAYEALWLNGVSSYKQVRDHLAAAGASLPSGAVEKGIATRAYEEALDHLKKANITKFGVVLDATFDYPLKLKDADYPLVLLYYRGCWDLVMSRGVAVVGTRKPSAEGGKRTEKLVKYLVEKDFTVFSGLAAGIDTVAHTTALKCGGRTVAVIGTPISATYPAENGDLQELLAQEHLVVSQVPICRYHRSNVQYNRLQFPERNKTMSALTEATIIVEAGETSGSITQGAAALKQGRKLLILSSCFERAESRKWAEKFERQGAVRVRDVDDIERALLADVAPQAN
jgi:DNA processing protein